MRITTLLAVLSFSASGFAQSWEIGGAAGGGFTRLVTASAAAGSARAGLGESYAAGAALTQDLYPRLSGQIRYTFRPSSLIVSSGSERAAFDAVSHAMHYDFLFHAKPAGSPVRPYLAAGAGVRIFRGTGREAAYQPAQDYVLLTRTLEWKPLISAGGGVQFAASPRVSFRLELRNYSTPIPKKVLAPAAGASVRGWLHEIVPLAGIGFIF